jgi:hypothetical protein
MFSWRVYACASTTNRRNTFQPNPLFEYLGSVLGFEFPQYLVISTAVWIYLTPSVSTRYPSKKMSRIEMPVKRAFTAFHQSTGFAMEASVNGVFRINDLPFPQPILKYSRFSCVSLYVAVAVAIFGVALMLLFMLLLVLQCCGCRCYCG